MSAPIPPPRARLADCVWLPRILAKARLFREGRLPPDYAARFGVVDGVDSVFLGHFGLTRDDLIAVAPLTDAGVAAWFTSLASATPQRIAEWNHLSDHLGKPGYPLEARFPVGLATTYAHLAHRKPETILLMLEMDEGLA